MNRRDFVLGSLAAVPFLGLLLPKPVAAEENIALRWSENASHPGDWFVLTTGFTETHLFRAGLASNEWYIRCGGLFRAGDLFCGTIAEAKREAERFTLETMQRGIVLLEKSVYRIRKETSNEVNS